MKRRGFLGSLTAGILGLFGVKALAASTPATAVPRGGLIQGVGVLRHPCGIIVLEDGTTTTCRDLAKQFAERVQNGSVLVLPSSKDEYGRYLWDFRIEGGPVDQVKVERNRG